MTASAIKSFEAALEGYAAAPLDPERHAALAAILAPALFRGQGAFFDHACSHAASARGGELLPALLSFMDRLTSRGGIAASEASEPLEWRSAAILAEIHPEDESHDPRFLDGLAPLARALATAAKCQPAFASLAPIALDLRQAKPGFDLFRFCMLPTQAEAIGEAALRKAHPNGAPFDARMPPRRWAALGASFAYPEGSAPESASSLLALAIGQGAEFPCSYRIGGQEFSAMLAIKSACDPFSCCARALDPEMAEIESDLAKLLAAFEPSELSAIIEPSAAPSAGIPIESAPIDSFGLSICSSDGALLDAIRLPPIPESLALAHALLSRAGVEASVAPPRAPAFEGQERLWLAPRGARPFDPKVWRDRVLGAAKA